MKLALGNVPCFLEKIFKKFFYQYPVPSGTRLFLPFHTFSIEKTENLLTDLDILGRSLEKRKFFGIIPADLFFSTDSE